MADEIMMGFSELVRAARSYRRFDEAAGMPRDVLVDLARERFAPSWGDPALVSPTQDAEEAIRRAFEATR